MIKGKANRYRIVNRAEGIYTSALTERLAANDALINYEQLANQALEASIAFDREMTKQLGPEEESSYEED